MRRHPVTSRCTVAGYRTVGLLAAVLVLVILSTGCGTPPISPREIVKRAVAAQGSLQSVRMELDSKTDLDVPNARRTDDILYTGVYQKPDRWRLNIHSSGEKTQAVIIGGRTFVKLPGSDSWTEKKVEVLEGGASPGTIVSGKYLDSAADVELVDGKGLKGKRSDYHLKFDLDMSKYLRAVNAKDVDPSVFAGRTAEMEVWVLKDSMYISKAAMRYSSEVPGIASGKLTLNMEVEFSEFNQPVKIEAPE